MIGICQERVVIPPYSFRSPETRPCGKAIHTEDVMCAEHAYSKQVTRETLCSVCGCYKNYMSDFGNWHGPDGACRK